MKIYTVGGAVRDGLLGLPVQDRDYVVVGANVEHMLAAGYKPVGADFPVFLHPVTHEEYALARTERKTAPGYKGFVFHTATNVSLEQDLQRRDLTINAMARDEHGHLIDPYSGQADLNHRLLRHVSEAFSEDPVRILRVARFAARFAQLGFSVADETIVLMQSMVTNGEIDHLVPERVWQEIARGLMESTPSRMFEVLRESGALQRLMPEVDTLFSTDDAAQSSYFSTTPRAAIDAGQHVMMILQAAANANAALAIRFAALTHDLGEGCVGNNAFNSDDSHERGRTRPLPPEHALRSVALLNTLCERLKVPSECRDLATITARWHRQVHLSPTSDASQLLALLDATDALRRPARFTQLLDTCAYINVGSMDIVSSAGIVNSAERAEKTHYLPRAYLHAALARLQDLDLGAVAKSVEPHRIMEAIHEAKLDALTKFIAEKRIT